MTRRNVRAVLIALCLLGLAASGTSAYVHYQLIHDASYTSFCDISASVNCETVYRSAYGSVAGVPVAVLGLLWFAFALLLILFVSDSKEAPLHAKHGKAAEPPPAESIVAGYLFPLSTIALAVVLYLAYASFVVLKTICILCVATYVAVIGIFIVAGSSNPAGLTSLPGAAARDLRRLIRHPVAVTLAVLFLAGAASLIAFFPRDGAPASNAPAARGEVPPPPPADQTAQFEQWMDAQPRAALVEPNDGAKVVILKFNDYQCPPCRQTYLEYKPILEKYAQSHPGQVKFVTKDFPLESECNTGGVHSAACEAAAAVRMARLKGKAEALEEWLLDNQPAMSPALVRQGVSQVGGVADFDAQYPRFLDQVRADVALGRSLGVNRTPTFFINGVKIEGGLRPQFFDVAIAHELKRAGVGAEKP
jgi:uncharacterized membrane protein